MTKVSSAVGNLQGLPEQARVRFVCADAIMSVGRALAEIDVSDPVVLARFESLVQQLQGLDTLLKEDIALDTPLATMLISLLVSEFMNPGVAQSAWDSVTIIDNQWSPEHEIKGTFDVKVLNASILSLFCLTSLYRDGRQNMELAAAGSRALLRLASTLERADRLESALACAHSARNVAFGDAALGEASSLVALRLAFRAGNLDNIAVLASLYADNLIILAQNDPARRVDAYDATERALRALRRQDAHKPELLDLFKQRTVSEAYLRPLQPTVWSLLPPAERPVIKEWPVSVEKLARILDTSISGTADEFVGLMLDLRAFSVTAEDLRLKLEPAGPDVLAHTSSHAWTVDHPALRRAVPHSGSFLRERDLDALLLVLQHEITHVLSLTSPLGLSLLVLRFSEFELEAELWGLIAKDEKATYPDEFFTGKIPTQLKDGNPAGLAWAEQQIDLERKAQILEDCWAPWFEGIAVFGETAADPRDEPDASSPTIDVLFNLWERKLRSKGDTEATFRQTLKNERTRAEVLYGEALERSAGPRLRGYLDTQHRHYLAGYLAVRSVVSAWRRVTKSPLSGAEAFRILLHVTRHSGFEAIPSFVLPVEIFQREARAGLERWLRAVADLTGAELESALQPNKILAYRWIDGRLALYDADDSYAREFQARVTALGIQALSSLRGVHGDASRVEGADEACRAALIATAELLGDRSPAPKLFTESNAAAFVNRLAILPLGSASCPFWLNPDHRLVACVIRTTEHSRDTGDPSYDLTVFTLEQESFDQLADRVRTTGESRLTVTRVADLSQDHTAARGLGRNLLVFQCGDWTHIQPRGQLVEAENVDPDLREAILSRLSPGEAVTAQQVFTGPDYPCIRRTKQWLDNRSIDWTFVASGETYNIARWAQHVRALAERVLTRDNGADRQAASHILVEFVLGNEPAVDRICDSGFADLRRADPLLLERLVKCLAVSGQRPSNDSADVRKLDRTITDIFGSSVLSHSPTGWDVILPHHLR